jgi:phosphoribosylformylglycinamidine cyclo-ligase
MTERITYKDAGVDVELAEKVLGSLSERLRATFRPEVLGQMGGFSAMFRPEWTKYEDPVLLSATDGVGTKLKIAFLMDKHDTVGIDLVAMNVNDILVSGAEPLFFLDYFATGAIDQATMRSVIEGIARGCEQAGCALIGGETAEMPDFYPIGEYDLAGFCVGIVDRSKAVDGSAMKPGHVVLGLASSGVHSNGFSLVRKVLLERCGYDVNTAFSDLGKTLGEELLTPTFIYVKPVLSLLGDVHVSGMAHITGGGFIGNIPRVVPPSCSVLIRKGSWDVLPIFNMLQRESHLDDEEMFRTFNMGIGFVITLPQDQSDEAQRHLQSNGFSTSVIGEVQARPKAGEPIQVL